VDHDGDAPRTTGQGAKRKGSASTADNTPVSKKKRGKQKAVTGARLKRKRDVSASKAHVLLKKLQEDLEDDPQVMALEMNGGRIACVACGKVVDHRDRSTILQHVQTKLHARLVKGWQQESEERSKVGNDADGVHSHDFLSLINLTMSPTETHR